MKIRLGVCSDCGAQYRIPVSFSANRAKCKQCGGVTEIGPPVVDPDAGAPKKAEPKAAAKAPVKPPVKAEKKNAPPMPAKKVRPAAEKAAPKPAAKKTQPQKAQPKKAQPQPAQKKAQRPKAVPPKATQKQVQKAAAPKPAPQTKVDDALVEIRGSGKKKGGMSMKERLLAERAAAANATQKQASPKRAVAAAGAVRAGAKAAAAAPKRASAAKTGSRSSARSGQRRAGGRRRTEEEDEEIAGASRANGGRRGRQKQSKAPMFVGLGLMAAAGVGGFLYMQNQSKATVEAADEEVAGTNTDVDEVLSNEEANGAANELIDEATGNEMNGDTDQAAPETPTETADEAAADEGTPAAAPEGGDPEPAPEKVKPAKDPASIDLTVYDFERAEGTTDEEWADIVGDVEMATDLDAGAAGTRALTRLRDAGRKAFPAVLNAMHDLDYATQDGIDNGDVLQKCLREILAGLSFNWFYTTEPDDVWKNKKAVQRWSNEWTKVVDDPAYWDKISAKATRKESERVSEPDPLGEAEKELQEELDDLDDL